MSRVEDQENPPRSQWNNKNSLFGNAGLSVQPDTVCRPQKRIECSSIVTHLLLFLLRDISVLDILPLSLNPSQSVIANHGKIGGKTGYIRLC